MMAFSNALFTDAVLLALIAAAPATLASIGALIVTLRGKKETTGMKNALIASAMEIGGDRVERKELTRMQRRRGDRPSDSSFLRRSNRAPRDPTTNEENKP